jgi:hypothetical protein
MLRTSYGGTGSSAFNRARSASCVAPPHPHAIAIAARPHLIILEGTAEPRPTATRSHIAPLLPSFVNARYTV